MKLISPVSPQRSGQAISAQPSVISASRRILREVPSVQPFVPTSSMALLPASTHFACECSGGKEVGPVLGRNGTFGHVAREVRAQNQPDLRIVVACDVPSTNASAAAVGLAKIFCAWAGGPSAGACRRGPHVMPKTVASAG
jgi:hypothetical protein